MLDHPFVYEKLKSIIQELAKDLQESNDLENVLTKKIATSQRHGIENAIRYATNIMWGSEDAEFMKTKPSFVKTLGSKQPIKQNKLHEAARSKTILHIRSNTVITWIPKNACSNIRYSVALDNGAISGIEDISWIHQNNNSFNATNKELLNAENSIVFLRNPFKRLLSFYLDKICHVDDSHIDISYENAKKTFNTDKETTFEDFVDIVYQNPELIFKDIHTQPQSDFLIYTRYCKYYSVERFNDATTSIFKDIGLKIEDIRNENSIFTTKGKVATDEINEKTIAFKIKELLDEGKSPLSHNMYTDSMIGKVAYLYMSDISLYHYFAPNAQEELKEWMHKLSSLAHTDL